MHVSAINSGYYTNPKYSQQNFKSLIKDKSAVPVIKNMSENDILELKQMKKRLKKTKYWDMKISGVGDKSKEFKFEFIDKKNNGGIITDGIHPYNKDGNTISIYTIVYGPENIPSNMIGTLRYRSSSRADIVYERYLRNIEEIRHRNFNLTPIESLKSKEIELNMLEEASHFAAESDKLKCANKKLIKKHKTGNDLAGTDDELIK